MKKISKPFIDARGEVRPPKRGERLRVSMLRDAVPELAAFTEKRKVGRPRVDAPKRLKSFKLSPAVIEAVMAYGKGYNRRVEEVLRAAMARGAFAPQAQ